MHYMHSRKDGFCFSKEQLMATPLLPSDQIHVYNTRGTRSQGIMGWKPKWRQCSRVPGQHCISQGGLFSLFLLQPFQCQVTLKHHRSSGWTSLPIPSTSLTWVEKGTLGHRTYSCSAFKQLGFRCTHCD